MWLMRWARSSPPTLAVPVPPLRSEVAARRGGPDAAGKLTFGDRGRPAEPGRRSQRQKVDLPMLDVYTTDVAQGAVKLRGRVFTPRPVTWRSRGDTLVVLKRFKSFSRGGDELQIFDLALASSPSPVCRWRARRLHRGARPQADPGGQRAVQARPLPRGGRRRSRQAETMVPNAADAVAEQGLHLPAADRARRARIPDSRRAADCALAAFRRLGRAGAAAMPRADQLTVQTWFDTDDFATLEKTFLERNRRAPNDYDIVHGLQEVYYKWGKWPQALEWSTARRDAARQRRRGAIRRRHLHLAGPGRARRRRRHGRLRSAPAPAARDRRARRRRAKPAKGARPPSHPSWSRRRRPPRRPSDITGKAARRAGRPGRSRTSRRRWRCARTTRTR